MALDAHTGKGVAPHVAWLARWRELRDQINAPGAQPTQVVLNEYVDLEDQITATPAESKPGLAAKAEVALWDLERQEAGDSLAALAPRDILAALEA